MYMSYSKNPNLPRVRMQAVKMLRQGHSSREVARHFGYSHSAVVKWSKKIPEDVYDFRSVIPTESSRPHHHPNELSEETVKHILEYRERTKRGADFIHFLLVRDGLTVSLSSVKRTLSRHGLTKYSKYKKWHVSTPRPLPALPGLLVEADTVHVGRKDGSELYIYTLIDVCSRWTYALPAERISANGGAVFVKSASSNAPFNFKTVQTDHGPEFSKWFTKKMSEKHIEHRHTRVRRPNDNAHIERFNRTIQNECIMRLPHNLKVWEKEIPDYIHYYNTERPHQGLDWLTPEEKLHELVPRS